MQKKTFYQQTNNGVIINLKLTPRSSKNSIEGLLGEDMIRIKLKAPPVDGKANKALIIYFKDILKCPESYLEIIHGFTGRYKKILIKNISLEKIIACLSLNDALQEITPKANNAAAKNSPNNGG